MSTDAHNRNLESRHVLGVRANASHYDEVLSVIREWSVDSEPRRVHILAVHGIMEAYDDLAFRRILNGGDLNTTDGMPVVWSVRWLGSKKAQRVYGPELTPRLLEVAARENIPVGFYGGSSPEAVDQLMGIVQERFEGIHVVFKGTLPTVDLPDVPIESRPFRPLNEDEDAQLRRDVIESGARILFVGLGCPRQERWMHEHRSLPLVMIGVGAAFDFLSGSKKQAPGRIQKMGLEWLFRLVTEPRRLWKRYLKHNPRFVLYFVLQWLGLRRYES